MAHAIQVAAPVKCHQTTKERCRIFHFGLDARETLVIESVFRMNPELGAHFVFGAPTSDDPVDVVFVNGDSERALAQWADLRQENPSAVAIIACSDERSFGAVRTIRKPLSFRNFETILDAITATDSALLASPSESAECLRVLVVDDSFPARQFMKFKLEELAGEALRVQIDFADSGEKALQCVHDQAYDLVFLDVVMPGIDGYETCARIKAEQPVRVAMLSSRQAPVDFTRGRASGCDNYLPKPPNDIDLRTVLRLTSLKKMTGAH